MLVIPACGTARNTESSTPSEARGRSAKAGLRLKVHGQLGHGVLVPVEFRPRDRQPASQALENLLAERLVDLLELVKELCLELLDLLCEDGASVLQKMGRPALRAGGARAAAGARFAPPEASRI